MPTIDFKSGTVATKDWLNDVDSLVFEAFDWDGVTLTTTQQVNVGNDSLPNKIGFSARQMNFISASANRGMNFIRYSTDADAALINFFKARGGLLDDTAITDDDNVLQINALGYVGATGGYVNNFTMSVKADTITNALNGLGGSLVFSLRVPAGNLTDRFSIKSNGSVVLNASGSALATNATTGFTYVPTCAGTPSGTPTAYTGTLPIVIDSTNHKLYFYSGGSWRDAGP